MVKRMRYFYGRAKMNAMDKRDDAGSFCKKNYDGQ